MPTKSAASWYRCWAPASRRHPRLREALAGKRSYVPQRTPRHRRRSRSGAACVRESIATTNIGRVRRSKTAIRLSPDLRRSSRAIEPLSESLRIDKWLWHARFCKTRALAQAKAAAGHVRVNGHRVEKPSATVRVGDVMTFAAGGRVIAVRVLGLGERRGPAPEARLLYEVLSE